MAMVNAGATGKRDRTRAALVEATLAIAEEQGFEAVTLDAVAARAGMTKGAIYSNFRNKGDLIWAAARGASTYLAPDLTPGSPIPDQARAFARALLSMLPTFERVRPFQAALQAYIVTDPDMQARQQASQMALFATIDRYVEAEFGERLRLPARSVTLAIQALIRGFLHQALSTPEAVSEDVVTDAFQAVLLGAMVQPTKTAR